MLRIFCGKPTTAAELWMIRHANPKIKALMRNCIEDFGDQEIEIRKILNKTHTDAFYSNIEELIEDFNALREEFPVSSCPRNI